MGLVMKICILFFHITEGILSFYEDITHPLLLQLFYPLPLHISPSLVKDHLVEFA